MTTEKAMTILKTFIREDLNANGSEVDAALKQIISTFDKYDSERKLIRKWLRNFYDNKQEEFVSEVEINNDYVLSDNEKEIIRRFLKKC